MHESVTKNKNKVLERIKQVLKVENASFIKNCRREVVEFCEKNLEVGVLECWCYIRRVLELAQFAKDLVWNCE